MHVSSHAVLRLKPAATPGDPSSRSYGLGFAWYLGPFELTWTWAKRLQNSIVVAVDTDANGIANSYIRIPDPFFDSSVQTSFYIGRSF